MHYSVNINCQKGHYFSLEETFQHCSVPCLMLSLCAQSFYDILYVLHTFR